MSRLWLRMCYRKAEVLSRAAGNERLLRAIIKDIGIVYFKQGNNDKAVEYYETSLAIARRLGDEATTAATLYKISFLQEKKAAGK